MSQILTKNFHAPAEDRTRDPSNYSPALTHVAIKAGLYRKEVQVYDIPNLYPVTVISGRRKGYNKRVCALEHCYDLKEFGLQ